MLPNSAICMSIIPWSKYRKRMMVVSSRAFSQPHGETHDSARLEGACPRSKGWPCFISSQKAVLSVPASFMLCSLLAIPLALCYRYQNAQALKRSRQRSNINPKLVRCVHFVLPDPNINKHPRAQAQSYSGEKTGTLRPNTPRYSFQAVFPLMFQLFYYFTKPTFWYSRGAATKPEQTPSRSKIE